MSPPQLQYMVFLPLLLRELPFPLLLQSLLWVNIGARRLHTIIERILDDISFTATDRAGEKIIIDSNYVKQNLDELVKDTDLSKFIL